MTPALFFSKYAAAAQTSCRGTGLLASVTLAQMALESGWGESYLTRKGFNFGGIKSGKTWKGETMSLPTKEEIKGKLITIQDTFRKYPNVEAYLIDRIQLFRTLNRYAALLKIDTYKAEAALFKATGYCTDSAYGGKLISIIEKYGLTKYDA